jgi:FkbM family methyltransferase
MKTFLKDCRWGQFLLLRGDMISVYSDLYGEWSEMEVRLFNKLLTPQSNVVEVGANLGLHSVPLAKIANKGKVICFEAQRVIFQILCANIAINDLINVFTYNVAVSDTEREITIQSSDYETPWNYGSFSIEKGMSTEGAFKGAVSSERVMVIKLDTFRPATELQSIDLLKIDAEQHETAVLNGAEKLVARHRPVIFVENNNAENGDKLIQCVKTLGYIPYWFCSARWQPDNVNRVAINIPGADANIVCFPNEREPLAELTPANNFSDLINGKVPLVTRVT